MSRNGFWIVIAGVAGFVAAITYWVIALAVAESRKADMVAPHTDGAVSHTPRHKARKVAIIDYHTGLGPWGFAEQIAPVSRDDPAFARAAHWYGASVTSPSGGTSTSADITGDGLSAASKVLPRAEVTGIALEVGTVALLDVLFALRSDAWLNGYGDVRSPEGRAIKKQMRDAFSGDADDWKGIVAKPAIVEALVFKRTVPPKAEVVLRDDVVLAFTSLHPIPNTLASWRHRGVRRRRTQAIGEACSMRRI